jgi:hypothetical protein
VGANKFEVTPNDLPIERVAFTVLEFCFRNHISRPAYHRLRAQGRGPVEMRIGLNLIRITAEAEREWQQQMQEPRPDLELKNIERAAMAGAAAAKSSKHVSKRQRAAGALANTSEIQEGRPQAPKRKRRRA